MLQVEQPEKNDAVWVNRISKIITGTALAFVFTHLFMPVAWNIWTGISPGTASEEMRGLLAMIIAPVISGIYWGVSVELKFRYYLIFGLISGALFIGATEMYFYFFNIINEYNIKNDLVSVVVFLVISSVTAWPVSLISRFFKPVEQPVS